MSRSTKVFLFICFFSLSSCASLITPPFDTIKSGVIEVKDTKAFTKDKETCTKVALAYKPPLSVAKIGNEAAQGGLSNASGVVANIFVPVIGAVGGAGSEVLREEGIISDQQWHVFVKCLTLHGERSQEYMVVEPD